MDDADASTASGSAARRSGGRALRQAVPRLARAARREPLPAWVVVAAPAGVVAVAGVVACRSL